MSTMAMRYTHIFVVVFSFSLHKESDFKTRKSASSVVYWAVVQDDVRERVGRNLTAMKNATQQTVNSK